MSSDGGSSSKKQKTDGSPLTKTLVNVLLKETGIARNLVSFASVPPTFRLLLTCKELHGAAMDIFSNYKLPVVCDMSHEWWHLGGSVEFKLYRAMVGTLNSRWLMWLDTSEVEELQLPPSVTDENLLIMFCGLTTPSCIESCIMPAVGEKGGGGGIGKGGGGKGGGGGGKGGGDEGNRRRRRRSRVKQVPYRP